MPTIQISKIQLRRGPASDLKNTNPLDDGELGFTNDIGRLFVGQNSPTNGNPNYNRSGFPYTNIEILTENSPLGEIIGPVFNDNQQGYLISLPLTITATFNNLQIYNSSNIATDFYIDLPNGGANANLNYFIFDSDNNSIRNGKLCVVWNTTMVGSPLCTDIAEVYTGGLDDIQWTATLVGSIGHQHVVIQYINQTSNTPIVYFRLDRPLI
jgi:hypothetical protein